MGESDNTIALSCALYRRW